MVNWSDPAEIARDYDVFVKLIFSLFGLYVWELFTTCGFEWSLITRRRNFRWPLIFFFFCRYCMLFALIGLILSLTVTTRINCGALYTFNSWAGNMTILCASTSLMLRTIALWERKRPIVICLGTLSLVHWGLLYRTMFIVKAEWNNTVKACVVSQTSPKLLNSTFFFTMAFDLVITLFTAIALLKKHSARTDLWKLLFQDGLIYFLVSFCMNSIPAVLNVLNLNTPMNVIATIPAATVTSIAACRAVIRLLDFHFGEAYIHTVSGISSSNPRQGATTIPKAPKYSRRPEIHVTTEHVTMAEFSPSSDSPYTKENQDITTVELPRMRKDSEGTSLDDKKDIFSYPSPV